MIGSSAYAVRPNTLPSTSIKLATSRAVVAFESEVSGGEVRVELLLFKSGGAGASLGTDCAATGAT